MMRVADDSDDDRRLLGIERPRGRLVDDGEHALAQRILIQPQRLRHPLIDDDRPGDSRLIRLCQQPALKQRNADQRKVAGRNVPSCRENATCLESRG